MIAPLTPFAIKGVVWYQGESDVDFATEYRTLFPALIADWRNKWRLGNFPFLYVQVAPFKKTVPEIREAQLLTLNKAPNTAMVVTTDCGLPDDIHPVWKQPVGYRLALAARALAYQEKIEYSGPAIHSYRIRGREIYLSFTHVSHGFMVKSDSVKGFAIAGDDNRFMPAKVKIENHQIIVSNDSIPHPKHVRFGWENVPDVNLYNKEGLPASPFRLTFNQ
jgi:sialate O-acetylesterase